MRRSAEPLAERLRSRFEIGRLVRDQEVGGSNPLAPTNLFNNLRVSKQVTRVPKERIWVGRPSSSRLAQNCRGQAFSATCQEFVNESSPPPSRVDGQLGGWISWSKDRRPTHAYSLPECQLDQTGNGNRIRLNSHER